MLERSDSIPYSMTNDELQQVIAIIGKDSKYLHFAKRIKNELKRDTQAYEHMHVCFAQDAQRKVGFCVLSSSIEKLKVWEKVLKEEGWVEESFTTSPLSFELMYMYIQPESRNKGKGTILLESALQLVKQMGGKEIYAYVSDKSQDAMEFYKKRGAKIIHDFSEEDEDATSSTAYLQWKV